MRGFLGIVHSFLLYTLSPDLRESKGHFIFGFYDDANNILI